MKLKLQPLAFTAHTARRMQHVMREALERKLKPTKVWVIYFQVKVSAAPTKLIYKKW
jgi:hypothetical protein